MGNSNSVENYRPEQGVSRFGNVLYVETKEAVAENLPKELRNEVRVKKLRISLNDEEIGDQDKFFEGLLSEFNKISQQRDSRKTGDYGFVAVAPGDEGRYLIGTIVEGKRELGLSIAELVVVNGVFSSDQVRNWANNMAHNMGDYEVSPAASELLGRHSNA